MTEAAIVRLVRCPKCENLLQERPDFSLYQCGGCGAVLKAKKKEILEEGSSEISDDAKGIEISEKECTVVKVSEKDMENADVIEGVRVESLHNEGVASNVSSTSLAEEREVLADPDIPRRGKESFSHGLARNTNPGKIHDFNVNFKSENIVKDTRPRMESLTSRPSRGPTQGRFDHFPYHDEGQSSYGLSSYYKHGDSTRNRGPDFHGHGRIENLENDRAELLRKLDELRDQISRSCDVADKPIIKKPLAPNPMGPPPYLNTRYGPNGPGPYPQNGYPHEFLPYGDIYQPEMLRRPQSQYIHQRTYHEHFPGYYEDFNQDPFMLGPHECSCVQCRDVNWRRPLKVNPSGFNNRISRDEPSILPRGSNLHRVTRSSSDLDCERDGIFNHHFPRKLAVRRGRVGYPVAGGAPFITCGNCFEILELPEKPENGQRKIKCGACSSIISFEIGNEGFVASASRNVDQIPTEIDQGSSENLRYWHYGSNNTTNDYDEDKKSTSSLSENEQSPESILSRKHDSPSPDNFPENIVVNKFENGSKSRRSENTSRQNSVKDATEIDRLSHDSIEISKEDNPKVTANKGGESFFAGFIKKSLRDLIKSNQSVEVGGSRVSINGHFLPDRVVKKAEKLAGPIQPGEYWYDKQAGFWGVMGHPCLGIIKPNIEEFNYPMPESCSAGNTGVLVNGRELNQKDLDLLASRGLPITRNRSYVIDITGKVVDDHTGEELDGLGKLAPTVERAKHGFGMKVPRFIAQSQS